MKSYNPQFYQQVTNIIKKNDQKSLYECQKCMHFEEQRKRMVSDSSQTEELYTENSQFEI